MPSNAMVQLCCAPLLGVLLLLALQCHGCSDTVRKDELALSRNLQATANCNCPSDKPHGPVFDTGGAAKVWCCRDPWVNYGTTLEPFLECFPSYEEIVLECGSGSTEEKVYAAWEHLKASLPTHQSTQQPTQQPSFSPTSPTHQPTQQPTQQCECEEFLVLSGLSGTQGSYDMTTQTSCGKPTYLNENGAVLKYETLGWLKGSGWTIKLNGHHRYGAKSTQASPVGLTNWKMRRFATAPITITCQRCAAPTEEPTEAPTEEPTPVSTLPPCQCKSYWTCYYGNKQLISGCSAQTCDGDPNPWCEIANPGCATEETGWSYCGQNATQQPTQQPSFSPTHQPTDQPTQQPTQQCECEEFLVLTGLNDTQGTYEMTNQTSCGKPTYVNENGAVLKYETLGGPYCKDSWAATNWLEGSGWTIKLNMHHRYGAVSTQASPVGLTNWKMRKSATAPITISCLTCLTPSSTIAPTLAPTPLPTLV